jgi:hypothetical protein
MHVAAPGRVLRGLAIALAIWLFVSSGAFAQKPSAGTPSQQPAPEVLAGLIRWTLTALSQANATGNYTV